MHVPHVFLPVLAFGVISTAFTLTLSRRRLVNLADDDSLSLSLSPSPNDNPSLAPIYAYQIPKS